MAKVNLGRKPRVLLDPGHIEGYNRGVISGYYEGTKMFEYALLLQKELIDSGFEADITRGLKEDPSLYTRAKMALNKEYDIFLSLHTNAYKLESACGAVGFVSHKSSEINKEFARLLVAETVNAMNPETGVTYTRGIHTKTYIDKYNKVQDYYGIIRHSNGVPFMVLLEHGFHTNKKECTYLYDSNKLKLLAEREANVMADFFGTTDVVKPVEVIPNKPTDHYRVRTSWTKPESQKGAYGLIENAKTCADNNPGYSVYDSNGAKVYPIDVIKQTDINVNGIYYFEGSNHYLNANAKKGVYAKPGRCKITRFAKGTLHPYHAVGVDGKSTVYGWIDATALAPLSSAPSPSAVVKPIVVGSKVKLVKAVTIENRPFKSHYSKYDVIQVNGNRIVIGIGKTVTAAVHKSNLIAI